MGVRAVFPEATLTFLHIILTLLRLKVVVRDVHQLELHFERQSIFLFPEFIVSVGKVTRCSFLTVVVFDEVFAKLCFKQIVQLLLLITARWRVIHF